MVVRSVLVLSLFWGWAAPAFSDDLDVWIARERDVAEARIFANISPPDALPGVVLASPSRVDPDYYFHWVRDAALTWTALLREGVGSPEALGDYVVFSAANQNSEAREGLGEPKFHVNGDPYSGDWARPQNDGPALRALALMRVCRGKGKEYSVIRRDLDYVAEHWRDPSFDLWEEVKGDHFYTRLVQRGALVRGAELVERLGDAVAAKEYREEAEAIGGALAEHYSRDGGYIVATENRRDGVEYKDSGLDTAVILAFLHAELGKPFLAENAPWIQGTIGRLAERFREIYPVNRRPEFRGLGFGRYPEDQYCDGNPWFLTTLGVAELLYELADVYVDWGQSQGARDAVEWADNLLRRVRTHAAADGSMAEQFDRNTGFMLSARDLTWSYSAFLTAVRARNEVLARISTGP